MTVRELHFWMWLTDVEKKEDEERKEKAERTVRGAHING
jgi:hypothetical protein